MFAAALKETEAHREAAAARKAAAEAEANALRDAKRELDRAIAAVRAAKSNGRGAAEADAAWKVAKARVIELETGSAPAWAPRPAPVVDEPVADEPVADEPASE